LDGGLDHPFAALPLGDVVGVGDRLAAHVLDLGDHLLRGGAVVAGAVGRSAEVVDHDFGALGGEKEGVFTADAAPCAGDDRDPAVKLTHRQRTVAGSARADRITLMSWVPRPPTSASAAARATTRPRSTRDSRLRC